MKVLNKLDSLDNINDGETRKLPTKTSQLTNDSGYITSANVPTKTSELINDNYFNYSIQATKGTIDDLAAFTSRKPGLTGSIDLTKKDSGVGSEIPAGWYNYYFSPHRNGSNNSSDSASYGTIIITPMSFNGSSYILRRSNNTTTITDVKKITTSSDLSNYIINSNSYINTHPENNPVIIPFIHNDIAFLLKRGGSAKVYYDDVEQTTDLSNAFDGSGNYWAISPSGITTIVIELTLHKVFTWTNSIYCDFGASGWRSKNVKIEVMNSNYAEDVWTSKYNTTSNASGNVKVSFTHTPVGASNAGAGFNKIRFTFSNWNNATIFRIAQLGVYNYGSIGVRETYMSRGIDDAIYRNITPNNNNTFNLGSSSNKWANVYATNFNGNATSATKATGDKNGNDITTTYATKTELENFSRNDLAILNSKTYTGLYGSSNDQDGASFYFASVRPTNFYDIWKVKYKVYANVPNQNNYKQYSIIEIMGNQDNFNFSTYNRLYSGNYRCYLYHNVYKLNSTGYNAGYSHALGIGLRGATNPTSSDYPRTVKIELLETENCTVTLLDTAVKRTGISGQGSTNFVGVTEFNGGDNGLQETGDATNTWQLRRGSGSYLASTALYRYMMLLTKNETTLIPMNAVNNSIATTKTLTTEEFDPFGAIYFYNSATTVNANSSINAGSLYYQCTFDLRYSFNTGTTLTSNKAIYLVAVPQSNGKAKLYSSPITQTLPTSADGRIYIYLGHAYNNYQIELDYNHPIYEYKDGAIRLYTNAAASGGGTITDVQVDGNSIVSNGVANLNTISTYNASTNPVATYNDISSKVDKEIAGASTDKTSIDHDGSLMTLEASNTNNNTESSIRLYPNGNLSLYGDNVYINNVVTPSSNGAAANKQYVDTQVATKQNTLVSGTNIKTINNQSLLGSGDLDIISGGDTLPVGAIIPYSGSTIPTNFLLADGSAVSRTTYSELFEAIGTTYGEGDGSTTFNLPDLKGKVPVGRDLDDTSFDVLGEIGGEKTHQLTVNEMPSHAHDTFVHSGGSQGLLGFMGLTNGSSSATLTGGSSFGIKNTGGSQAHNNLQPYITQNYIIKAKKSTTALDLGYITDSYSDSTTDAYSANMVNSLLSVSSGNDTLPIGAIVPFSGDSTPTNYLLADGSAVSRTTYNELFDVIGTTYGVGDGSTTFNLPNLKGRIPVGLDSSDTNFDTLGETGGEKTHKLTISEMPSHTHDQYVTANNGNQAIRRDYSSDGSSAMFPQGCATASTGGGQAHNNLQPYITQKYLIKAKMSTSALNLGLVTDTYSDSTTDAYSANYVNNLLKNILLDNIYPIGSIYMSINNTNPSRLFGGTWESWGAGRVPVGVDANDTDFDTVEETGGEKTHTLTTTEMPSHGHGVTWTSNCPPWVQAGGYGQVTVGGTAAANRTNTGGLSINNSGGSQAHNNLQPYITCYMWKRTA